MVAQIENRASVFSCDGSIVFSIGRTMPLTPGWNTTLIPAPKARHGTMAETLAYMEAWDAVVKDKRFSTSDWIVKVSPDTVFFANRLREKFRQHPVAKGSSPFFLNCEKGLLGEPTLLGSVEVFSRGALEAYRRGSSSCKELPWTDWTENTYIQQCLVLLKVESIVDGDMVADKRCQPARCSDISKVAYHGYGDASSYLQCWEKATEVAMASNFMKSLAH
mmetsp:Transcript_134679/g.418554  ORF Transcript_134679/g.418554 Transcript_134679/m.418554 type:complete len:220 (+) Transcript_134679:139-798(+)